MANETILRKGFIGQATSKVEGTLSAEALAVINSAGATQYTLPTADGANGEIMVTDGSGNLSFQAIPSGVTTFAALNDTDVSSLAAGYILKWDGTDWVSQAAAFAISEITGLQTALDSKLESSDLTGYATETYVNTAVSNLVDSAPGTLDTLNELAAALGDDPNFATTVTNSLANKLENINNESITDLSDVTNIGANGDILVNSGGNVVGVSTITSASISDFSTEAASAADTQIAAANIEDLNNVSGVGTTGQVLVSDGTGFAPATLETFISDSDTLASDSATAIFGLTAVDSYAAATVHYSLKDNSGNMRMGQLMVIGNGSNAELTDISTNSLGSETDEPIFTAGYNGASLEVRVTDGSGYTIKTKYIQVNA